MKEEMVLRGDGYGIGGRHEGKGCREGVVEGVKEGVLTSRAV